MKKRWVIGISAIMMLVLLAGIATFNGMKDSQQIPKGDSVTIKTVSGNVEVNVEIADDDAERTAGLMYRTELDSNSGMLFVFMNEQALRFWMKNTLIPLDMIFITEDGMINEIKRDIQPCKEDPCETYQSIGNAKYVLEVNAGFSEKNNIKAGDEVISNLAQNGFIS